MSKDLREGQRTLDRAIARTVHGLAHVMEKNGMVHLGVSELKEAVGSGCDAVGMLENAWAGVAEASGEGREEAAIEAVVAHFGRLDALLNIAGGFVWQTTDDADPAWAKMFALNVTTALNASRAALPHLKAGTEGRIVNVGANAALKSAAGMGAYAASKAGVHRLTESLAEELKGTPVTVNAVLPSILDTARNREDMPDADPAKWVAPADLARVMLFLASPESRAITGALIPVTGRV